MGAPAQGFGSMSQQGSQFDCYLKLDGIKGESLNDKHKDQIEVVSFTHTITQPVSSTRSTAGGASTGRSNHGDIQIGAFLDISYPTLAVQASSGKPVATGQIDFCRAGGTQLVFLTIKMEEILISHVTLSANQTATNEQGDQLPIMNFHLNYGKIEWTYTQQKRKDGSGGGNATAKYDVTAGKS